MEPGASRGTPSWSVQLAQALREREWAESAFQWADAEYLDYHIYRLMAAEEKISLILRQARRAYGIHPPSLPAPVPTLPLNE